MLAVLPSIVRLSAVVLVCRPTYDVLICSRDASDDGADRLVLGHRPTVDRFTELRIVVIDVVDYDVNSSG